MLKKLRELTDKPQAIMSVVAVVTMVISIAELIIDDPSPGVAYVMGFLNSAVIMTLFFYMEDES